MSKEPELWPYAGSGQTISERNKRLSVKGERVVLPPYEATDLAENAGKYVADDRLRAAVNVALLLGQPLLITGEPGTGKTQLAWSIAHELELPAGVPDIEDGGGVASIPPESDSRRNAPFVFHTKTTSNARDIFYRYDALRHFQDIQLGRGGSKAEAPSTATKFNWDGLIPTTGAADPDPPSQAGDGGLGGDARQKEVEQYITFEALGLAILLTMKPGEVTDLLPEELRFGRPVRSVVLIDEIDKAPRDLPNDILHEIEDMSFEVKELGRTFKAEKSLRPIIILTSNSERNLPDAFLRRCVFYHIPFPEDIESLKKIVAKRLDALSLDENSLSNAIAHFLKIRKLGLQKPPATAELIAWLRLLERNGLDVEDGTRREEVIDTYFVLAKNKDDWEAIRDKLWPRAPAAGRTV